MKPSFVFFGTPDIAVTALDALFSEGFIPSQIVTAPDSPQGRGLVLTPSPVKVWAQVHNVPVLQPEKLSDAGIELSLESFAPEFFIVVAYGKIIPKRILDIPHKGTLNLHPSLLPRHRGPSPIESQILHEQNPSGVGVSIMLLDEKMDHGPVLAQQTLADITTPWPITARALRELLAHIGAQLLTKTLSDYLVGTILPIPQHDDQATYCKMISKEDGRIDLTGDPYTNYLKILAYNIWPRAYFFTEKNGKQIRVVVTEAHFKDGVLVLEKVIPEGRKEMSYKEFLS